MTDLGKIGTNILVSMKDLNTRVDTLAASNVKQAKRSKRDRLMIFITIAGLFLDLGLSGVFIAQHIAQTHTNNSIECQNSLRAAGAAIAESDRANVTNLILVLGSGQVTTPIEVQKLLDNYKNKAHANDLARARIGQGKATTCN